MHAAMVTSMVRNVFRGKGSKQVSMDDFMLVSRSTSQKKRQRSGLLELRAIAKPASKAEQKRFKKQRKQRTWQST